MKKFSAQRGIVHIVPLLVILAIIGVAIWFFLNKSGLESSGMKVQITPSQLMPFVSAKEARTTICNLKKEGLFPHVCQSKFDVVGKDDGEKIVELFALLDKIKNNQSISDYDRLLLAQVIFAALPIGDNPESSLYQPMIPSRLKDYLTSQITVYAQEKTMSEEDFKAQMTRDLQNMVDNLPKGDNAWVINIMVSKHSWQDGKSQPLYSHQYMESFDPFPNNSNADTKNINYHVQSVVGSKVSGQTADVGGPSYKGTSDIIGYSFTIMSWNSEKYSSKDGPVNEQFLVRKRNRSDSSYQGELYLASLLDSVKLPSTKRPIESSDTNRSRDTESKESSSPKPSAPATIGSSDSSSEDVCRDPASFCKAIKDCANQATEENSKFLSYEERYQRCSKSYQEGWYEAAGWLSCPWWKEQELKSVCYENKCNPLSKEIEARRGDDAYREWDKVAACMEECDEQANQAAASLKLPKCDSASQ